MRWLITVLATALMIAVTLVVNSNLRREMRASTRQKAQAAADAGALAGASAFIDFRESETEARKRTVESIRSNSSADFPLTVDEDEILIDPVQGTLTVTVTARAAVPGPVAWVFGLRRIAESAEATAEAQVARCVDAGTGEDGVRRMQCTGIMKELRLVR